MLSKNVFTTQIQRTSLFGHCKKTIQIFGILSDNEMMILAAITLISIGCLFLFLYFKQNEYIQTPSPAQEVINIKPPQPLLRPDSFTNIHSKKRFINHEKIHSDQDTKSTRLETNRTQQNEQLISKGILFMDKSRRMPSMLGNFAELPVRFFDELRRVGSANLIIESGVFLIRSGNATFHYGIGDLEQILFQTTGVALVPLAQDRSIALFITDEVETIRNHIKNNIRLKQV